MAKEYYDVSHKTYSLMTGHPNNKQVDVSILNGNFRGITRAVALNRPDVIVRPGHHVPDQRQQAFTQGGQAVFHFGRDLGIHFPGDQSIRLEVANRSCQHLLRDVPDGLAQLVEAHHFVFAKLENDQCGPLVTDPVQHLPDGAVFRIVDYFQLILHVIVLTISNSFFGVTGLPECAFLVKLGGPDTFDSPKVT